VNTKPGARTSWSRSSKQLTRVAVGLCAFALASSVLATPRTAEVRHAAPATSARGTQVVLLALDGVRYEDVFGGVDAELAARQHLPPQLVVSARELMPNLHALMHEHGAALGAPGVGAPISASGPEYVSLPGYAEMLTGRRLTGCLDNGCNGTKSASIVDELAQARSSASSAVIASWPDIERVAASSDRVAVSTGRHAGRTRTLFERTPAAQAALRRAEGEAPWPGLDDFRRDRFTADLALAYLEEARPELLFIGLGEPDEFAHQGNYAGYLDSLRHADERIGQLATLLAARAATGVRTALFVTADHGRARNFRDHGGKHPESARVWLVASGSAIGARGLTGSAGSRWLADIAPTVRQLLGLPVATGQLDPSAGSPLRELLLLPGQ
jgi:hypothetical protein